MKNFILKVFTLIGVVLVCGCGLSRQRIYSVGDSYEDNYIRGYFKSESFVDQRFTIEIEVTSKKEAMQSVRYLGSHRLYDETKNEQIDVIPDSIKINQEEIEFTINQDRKSMEFGKTDIIIPHMFFSMIIEYDFKGYRPQYGSIFGVYVYFENSSLDFTASCFNQIQK